MALVNRDVFARQETHRETVHVRQDRPAESCAWCGGVSGRGTLYRYRMETDGGRRSEDARCFCSVSCRRAYYS